MHLGCLLNLDSWESSTLEISTECFSEQFVPDVNEGKYSSHGIILQHFLSKCFDNDLDPDLDLEIDESYNLQPMQEND